MLADKSRLLEQINLAIRKKWSKKIPDVFGYPIVSEKPNEADGFNDKNLSYPYIQQNVAIKKLEERIESLENLNEHLFYFISFLIENLPDLVINIVQNEWDTHPGHSRSEQIKNNNGLVKSPCEPAHECPCPTRREKDILELLVKGFCAKEIANRLFISESTVITHKKNLKEKFQAKNTVELISKAYAILAKEEPG